MVLMQASRHHLRTVGVFDNGRLREEIIGGEPEIRPSELNLEPGIHIIAERAQSLTGATGAAIAFAPAMRLCAALVPGARPRTWESTFKPIRDCRAECMRTGEILLCHDAESNPRVDIASCRRLGARSILVAPLRHFRNTLGVFEVLSSTPYAFDHRDVSTMQLLSSVMVAAMMRLSFYGPSPKEMAGLAHGCSLFPRDAVLLPLT